MSKTLVIEARVPLSDDMFEAASTIAAVGDVANEFREVLSRTGDAEMTVRTVTMRAPRANGAAKPGRKPKSAEAGEEHSASLVS